jgi:hypothetical protein
VRGGSNGLRPLPLGAAAVETTMWITLTPAIIGLVGVFVGALITTGANYWFAVTKEAVEAANDKAKRR